jgi:outer membrane protein
MKKRILVLMTMLALSVTASVAQKVMVVDSEKIFKSIEAYNTAISEADATAQQYQKQIDDAFNELETRFNNYQNQKATMSAAARQKTEQEIIAREDEITKFQETVFGEEGTVIKKRVELIKPIQDKVFAAIDAYAQNKGFDMVIDKASNATLLYISPSADHTDAIIAIVK